MVRNQELFGTSRGNSLKQPRPLPPNYQEAKGAYSRREFAAKNGIVLKELKESKVWYRIIIRCELGSLGEPRRLVKEADELVAMFTAGMKRLSPFEPAQR